MPNDYFRFKQFTVFQDRCAMKVTTDGCLFGAWVAEEIRNTIPIAIGNEIRSLLDVGAGTGLLSLMIAQKNDIQIDAVEIEPEAAQQARENISRTDWKDRVHVINSDIRRLEAVDRYGYIVANPPFYENEIISAHEDRNTAHHSEQLKLDEVFSAINKHLSSDGRFFLLLPSKREAEINRLLNKYKFFTSQKVYVKQTSTHAPFRIMIEGCRNEVPVSISEIIIAKADRSYTAEFASLLRDYYLFL